MARERPPELLLTPRLVLRKLGSSDASSVKEAIDKSLQHLLPFVPWATKHPAPLRLVEAELGRAAMDFERGKAFRYGVFSALSGEALGGVGLYRLVAPDALELGYWLRESATGKGYATEAAKAATEAGFMLPQVVRLEIHVEARNERSRAVPVRLGYEFVRSTIAEAEGERSETLFFEMWRPPVSPWDRADAR